MYTYYGAEGEIEGAIRRGGSESVCVGALYRQPPRPLNPRTPTPLVR